MKSVLSTIALINLIVVGLGVGRGASADTKPASTEASTLDNLMAAFNGESNANAKYEAFAQKAEEEGYGPVASLFRAAARAEKIHAHNHAEIIKKMGGEAKADIKKAEVQSTAENLKTAIKGETYERDTMYPEFIAKARRDRNKDALRTFNLAKAAEAEHASLYAEALENLDSWKGEGRAFYVCPVCGYTAKSLGFDKCPSCFTPKADFKKIS